MHQIGLKKFWSKNTVPCTYLNSEEITGTFYKKELKKTYIKEFRTEKSN